MNSSRSFVTKSSTKYLANRTVSLPFDFVVNTAIYDSVNISIKTPFDGVIDLYLTGEELVNAAQLKQKEDHKFFVLKY